MRHHLVIASLLLSACAFDRLPSTATVPTAPVAQAAERGSSNEVAWRRQALLIVSEGGRRWVVLASGLDDDAGVGPTRVISRDELVATLRAPREGLAASGASVIAHDRSGARCELRVDAPVVLSRVALDSAQLDAWNGHDPDGTVVPRRSDADIAEEGYQNGSGGRLLAAEVLDSACAEALWAQPADAGVARYGAEPADARTRRAALAAYRATEAWRSTQETFREYSNEVVSTVALWDELRSPPEVTVWRSRDRERVFVTVQGSVPSEGCGEFAGNVWSVFEQLGQRLVSRGARADDDHFAPLEVVDADGDGAPEFITGGEVRAMGPSGYERSLSVSYPVHGCRC